MTEDERRARAEERRAALEARRGELRLARELRVRVEAIILERRLEEARVRGETMAVRRSPQARMIRERVVRWERENPGARRAHRLVHKALRSGKLVKPGSCDGCGLDRRLEAHHASYSRPLEVAWLCRSCHRRLHRPDGPYEAAVGATVPEESGMGVTAGRPGAAGMLCGPS